MPPLMLYNTLSRKKEEFTPTKDNAVRWYACGPTVYDYAHIGNFRAYVWEDILRRWFECKGWKVIQAMNLTDVDDKTIKRSQEKGIALKQFTEGFAKEFFSDMEALNIEKAEFYPRATEHIGEMVEMIKTLLKKGVAYKGDDGSVYYAVSKFPSYGKLSHTKLEGLKKGARVSHDSYDKESASDFALWKAWDAQDGEVFWETELGKGRPGWHIECSAMAQKYLGKTLDAHAGGVDLAFPHHENEIAQSEACNGKTFARFWLHCEHLLANGRKMSKSLGNYHTLREVLQKGHSSAGVRWLLLSAHYRQQLNFTFEALESAEQTVKGLFELSDKLSQVKTATADAKTSRQVEKLIEETTKKFESAMDDDLNTPHAISAAFELVKGANKLLAKNTLSKKDAQNLLEALRNFDKVFGVLDLAPSNTVSSELDKFVQAKLEERDAARSAKDYKKSDEIRKQLLSKGVEIQDTPQGTKWKKV